MSTNTNRDSIARDQDQNEDDLQDQTTTQNSLVTNRRIGTTDVLGLRLCAVNDKLVTMSRKCVARRWEEPQVDCQLSSLWLHATPAVDDRPLYIIYRPNCCVTVTRSRCFYFFCVLSTRKDRILMSYGYSVIYLSSFIHLYQTARSISVNINCVAMTSYCYMKIVHHVKIVHLISYVRLSFQKTARNLTSSVK